MLRVAYPSPSIAVTCGLVAACFLSISCSEPPRGDRKATVPLTGTVLIDGQPPSSPVKVSCIPQEEADDSKPSVSWGMTDGDGKFAISTYESGDGVPPGDYKLTFFWGKLNLMSNQFGGPDRLNGNYDDPSESPVTVKIEPGDPVDLGNIELKSSKKKKKK